MADFRKPTDLVDPRLTEYRVLLGENDTLDLWGGSDLTVFLDSENSVTLKEEKGRLPQGRRRFTLSGKAYGTAILEARVGGRGGRAFVRPLTLVVPKPPTKAEFIQRLVTQGKPVAESYGLPPSIMIAQAMLESTSGTSNLALKDDVLYGITKRKALSDGKETDWYPACDTIVLHKTIAIAGQPAVQDRFCGARSYEKAVRIWAQYVKQHPASKARQGLFKGPPWTDAERKAIADHMPRLMFGAGHTGYPEKLMQIIADNGLTAYD